MHNYMMYAIIKEGTFYSIQHDDWFDEFHPSCLFPLQKIAEQMIDLVGGRVVIFKVEMHI